jgi:methionine-S-sulfoxide reductase
LRPDGREEDHILFPQVGRHAEAVQVIYDPARIGYAQLLEVFWMNIDPTDAGGQFVDRGSQYRSAIFFLDEEQKRLAEGSRKRLARSGRFNGPIVTEIVPATAFYPAEEYHQDLLQEESPALQILPLGLGSRPVS